MKKFFEEFKAFISKGTVVDMAVAVIIGGAFSKIVTSLVNDIVMPLISLLLNGVNVTDWKWVIKAAEYSEAGQLIADETALAYGNFLQTILEFLIIAFSIFLMLKVILSFKARLEKLAKHEAEKQVEEAAEAAETTEDILKDIRALLSEKKTEN